MYALTPLKKAVFPVLVSSFLADLGHIHMGLRAKASKNPPDHTLKRHSLRRVSSVKTRAKARDCLHRRALVQSGSLHFLEVFLTEVYASKYGTADVSAAEDGAFEHCFPERSVYQIGSVQTRTSEIGSGEISMTQIGVAQIGHTEVSVPEVGFAQVCSTEIGSAEIGLIEEGTASICSRQVCARQVRSNEEGVLEIGPAQIGPGEMSPVQIGLVEVDIFEVGFTQIRNGCAMDASPSVPGLGTLLEQFEVVLVCHLDHLLVNP